MASTQVKDEGGQLFQVFVGNEAPEEESYIFDIDAKWTRKDEYGHGFADQVAGEFLVELAEVVRKR